MNGGESKRTDIPGYVFTVPENVLDIQLEAVQNLCREYNKRNRLSEMKFYPYGGCMYKKLLDKDVATPWCYETNDVDGHLVILSRSGLTTTNQGLRKIAQERLLEVSTGQYPVKSKVKGKWVTRMRESFSNVFENFDFDRYKNILQEAYETTFKREENGEVLWLTDASTSNFTLSIDPNAFVVQDASGSYDSNIGSSRTGVFNKYPTFDSIIEANFFQIREFGMGNFTEAELGVNVEMNGETKRLDIHLTCFHPPLKNFNIIKVMDKMYKSQQVSRYMFYPQKEHFLVDQMRVMFSRLYDYLALAVFDNERDIEKWQLYQIFQGKKTISKTIEKSQGLVKAMKTLCRVDFFYKQYSEFPNMLLSELYENNKDLGVQDPKKLKSSMLKEEIGKFNTLIMFELDNPGYHHIRNRYPTSEASIPRSSTQRPEAMLNLTISQKNSRVKKLICDDMTLSQTMTLINHMIDNVKDKANANLDFVVPLGLTQLRERLVSAFELKNSFNLSLRF